MKRKIYLSLILFLGAFSAFADSYKSNNPMSYPYYIMGEQKITGRNTSTLNSIEYKGFDSRDSLGNIIRTLGGKRTIDEKIRYVFPRISTSPYIDLENKELQYWRQLDGGVWMSDVESGNGISNTKLDKDACFLLVLDESSSLGDDFYTVKQGTKVFIEEMYKASSEGNIRIGIICFSTMDDTKIFPITSLTYSSMVKMQGFIENQYNRRKATSMYYSINKGINMLDEYVNQIVSSNEYENAHIITFTDGLDNTSQLEEEELYAANEIYQFVKNKLKTTKIKNKLIDSWVIGVQGDDVQTVQLDIMKNQLESLASRKSQFIWLNNISDLIGTFSSIAINLTDQWKNLSCTSALNHNGLVCWTLGERPKVKKHMLLGVNVGAGFGLNRLGYENYWGEYEYEAVSKVGYKMDFGVDFAYPITTRFGLGCYLSGFFDTGALEREGTSDSRYVREGTRSGVSFGLLTTIGNYHEKAAFMAGLGCSFDDWNDDYFNADIRLGVLLKNGLYFMTTMSVGSAPYSMTLNLGYNFGALFEVK